MLGGWGDKNVIHITSMPKHWHLQRFLSQASMPFATMPKTLVFRAVYAQNAGIYRVFASLYNRLHKDVEQEGDVQKPSRVLHSYAVLSAFVQSTLIQQGNASRQKVDAEVRCQLTPKPQIEYKSK